MKEKNYIAYIHACWVSQWELTSIFEKGRENAKIFFEEMSDITLWKYISNQNRRQEILEYYAKLDTKKIDALLEKLEIQLICLWDDNYPQLLKNITHTPYILYVRWTLPESEMFWVVGSRKISSYGSKCIEKIIPELSKVFTIVSGWALGCDSAAHKTTLQHGWKTIVVVGTGIDKTYPASNAKLFEEVILSWGALISIFRLGEPGNPYNFPIRNEIVVWLSKWVLVIEAKEKSWSLITAWLCLDYWKDLFSIPWDITMQNSSGTNKLIKSGEAKCVTESLDILEEYNILVKKQSYSNQIPLLDELESQIFSLVSWESLNIDDLIEILYKNPSEIMMKMSLLELKWIVKKDISGKYSLI